MPSGSIRAAVDACLEKIDRDDGEVQAWVHVDGEGARRTAGALDAETARGRGRRLLEGVPVGLKDIFDVAGMPTASGARPFAHRRPERDAPAVAALRAAGAVILGKTVTTEFAFADPSITRNPWNLEHTPGGSSSGSAAAVAAGMARVALGSQTIGSTVRPAAYCGVVGFKGTYGRISTEGVTPLSWSLDHVGIFARTVDDAAAVFSVLAASPGEQSGAGPAGGGASVGAPRIGVPWVWIEKIASPEVRTHLRETVARLARAGAVVEDVALPESAAPIEADGRLVLRVEAAAYHSRWFAEHAREYGSRIRELVEAGLGVPAINYIQAHETRYRFRREMGAFFDTHDALVLPAAPAAAPPLSEGTTGDPVFCAPWSFAGFPAIAIPSGLNARGLPLSVQLVGPVTADERLLEIARWCEGHLAYAASPPL